MTKHPPPASYLELCDRVDKQGHRIMLDATPATRKIMNGTIIQPGELRLLYIESKAGTRLAQASVAGDLEQAASKMLRTYAA